MVAQIDKEMLCLRPWKIPGRLIAYVLIEGRPLTTRGGWINPLVFLGYWLAQFIPAPYRQGNLVCVVGTGRSGTTILGKTLSVHRDVAFLNEPKALWHFAYPNEDLIGSYTTKSADVVLPIPLNPRRIARRISRVYRWAQFWSGANCVVDKYPELVFRDQFVLSVFPKARFVTLLRDGVDTCSSIDLWSKKKGVTSGHERHDWWGRDDRKWHLIVEQLVPTHPDLAGLKNNIRHLTDHRDRAAIEWIVSMRAARNLRRNHPDVVHEVRYENLCEDPKNVLGGLLEFCGLADDSTFFRYGGAVLSPATGYPEISLHPLVIQPFCETLSALGYGESCARVRPRLSVKDNTISENSGEEYANSSCP